MFENTQGPSDCHAGAKQEDHGDLNKIVPTDEELGDLYKVLATCGKPAILSIVPNYCDDYMPAYVKGTVPPPLTNLFKEEYVALPYTELLDRCNQCFSDIKVTPAQAKIVEESTRSQAKSKIWFQQRSGRITASKLKAAVRTDITHPSRSLIMSICYPQSQQFHCKATQWGCKHEQTARDTYIALKEKLHQNFDVRSCGLFINPTYPHMGATPDGIITCTCCSGIGVLEVKLSVFMS